MHLLHSASGRLSSRQHLLCFLIILLTTIASPSFARIWTDSTAKHRTDAELVRIDGEKVVLRKTSGKEITVQVSKLSTVDQQYIASYKASQEKDSAKADPADMSRNATENAGRNALGIALVAVCAILVGIILFATCWGIATSKRRQLPRNRGEGGVASVVESHQASVQHSQPQSQQKGTSDCAVPSKESSAEDGQSACTDTEEISSSSHGPHGDTQVAESDVKSGDQVNSQRSEEEPKALRLARYLSEYVGLRSATIRDVVKYETVLWFGNMPQEQECQSPAWTDDFEPGDPWLVVQKQQFPKPPDPPEIIHPWIETQALRKATPTIPQLRQTIQLPDTEAIVDEDEALPLVDHILAEHPEVTQAFERFRPNWDDWSTEYRRRVEIQNVYAELFRMHTQVLKEGEIVELVLGLGFLDWTATVKGKALPIRRHVVVAHVDLKFDLATGVIRLEGAAEGAQPRIEDDMLEAELRPERSHYASVGEQLNAIGDDVWDRSSIHAVLRSWAGALHADSQWSPDLKAGTEPAGRPLVSFAPALILRKRNQRGMVRIYNVLIDRLSSDKEEVPTGWGGLIEDEDDLDETDMWEQALRAGSNGGEVSSEIYFPLPANREQRSIVDAINHRRGVLVQGPPGTGKSHTIANLVCHLLATGKRVLITAETARALQVLKNKLPEEIQPLCVSLLGQGGDAFAELNAAVQGITTRQAAYRPGAYDDRIAEIEHELDASRRALAKIDAELRGLREDETCPHSLMNGVYQGTASQIASRVADEREYYGWLRLPSKTVGKSPLDNHAVTQWLETLSRYNDETIAYAKLKTVDSRKLPAPTEFSTAVTAEKESRQAVESLGELRDHPVYLAVIQMPPDERSRLAGKLSGLEEQRRLLERPRREWLRKAMLGVLGGEEVLWHALHDRSRELLTQIDRLRSQLGPKAVSLPEGRNPRAVRSDAAAVAAHIEAGGKWKTLGLFTPKPVRGRIYLREEVTVGGVAVTTQEQLRTVCDYLDARFAMADLENTWADHASLPSGADQQLRLIAIKEHVSILERGLAYAEECNRMASSLAAMTPLIPEPNWLNGQGQEWINIIEASASEQQHRTATERVTACLRELHALSDLHDVNPVVRSLACAVEQRDVTAYSQGHAQLLAIEQCRFDQEQRHHTETRLGTAVPGLIEAVTASLSDPAWNERFASWEQGWCWAIADNWLQKRTNFAYQEGLWCKRHETEKAISQLLAEGAALRAWTHFFGRLSPKETASLKSWRGAVKAMGKGTGRSAKMQRLRREARDHMTQCREAIPVWIMPRYLVAEMIDPAPNRYDLVIVDEASQLGIESLFLFYIAKKMVVVGDDQQISPYGVGIADKAIADLQKHYLGGIPHHYALSAQSSLYENAKIRFTQNIVLREHFRCMPEIIQFSNDLCYAINGTPLDPLRTYGADRLQPLVLRHVSDGYRTGGPQHAQNLPEADAIVAQIAACIDDPRYVDRTMGVISLQGDTQARLIERKLLELLEPEIIEERRLICGDAYAFQGDERHIIFLSMVAAPGETRIGVLSGESARQRFNVAASRAQDQLWLFYSAGLDVLSGACMRYRLLSYMLHPGRQLADESEQRFDSPFERDVFGMLTAKGFHVRTQVCVGDPTNHHYRIDLVVEGMQGRLAVECDGEKWHGPDRYEKDMARQRDLERAGWQFVRIRGGDFYRDRSEAMKPVWAELDRLGIKPGGVDVTATEPPPPANLDQTVAVEVDECVELPVTEKAVEVPAELRAAVEPPAAPADNGESNSRESQGVPQPGCQLDLAFRGEGQGTDLLNDAPSETPATSTQSISLPKPYVAFDGHAGPDPRTATPEAVAEGLCRIIEVEGPMLAKRAYDVYLRGCGIMWMEREVKKLMNRALGCLVRQGVVVAEDEMKSGGFVKSIVRVKGADLVCIRKRGPRTFEEIPGSEVRVVARLLSEQLDGEFGSTEHVRAVNAFFDLA
jgi:very-short-patch-repair endonuclease